MLCRIPTVDASGQNNMAADCWTGKGKYTILPYSPKLTTRYGNDFQAEIKN